MPAMPIGAGRRAAEGAIQRSTEADVRLITNVVGLSENEIQIGGFLGEQPRWATGVPSGTYVAIFVGRFQHSANSGRAHC
jgi:hypothetical protein